MFSEAKLQKIIYNIYKIMLHEYKKMYHCGIM